MNNILCIETGTEVCSVSLSQNSTILGTLESSEPQAHARLLAVFIDRLLRKNSISPKDLNAIAVSEGPGSYTGLRIGVSTAKGICFGANLPLIAVGSLDALVQGALAVADLENNPTFCPMIDARRMEVYTATFSSSGEKLTPVEAVIVNEESFASLLDKGIVYFFGNGAAKCAEVIKHPNAKFLEIAPSAANMLPIAAKKLENGTFVDVAYFEPFYLKDFVVTKSKKNLLGL